MAFDVAVLTFPGSNCDADLRWAVDNTPQLSARAVWHKETELGTPDAVLLPGGFSYGDYLRCGAIARFSPIMDALQPGTPTGTDVSDWYFDFHIGGDSLSVAGDYVLLNIARDYLAAHGSKIRGVVLEENGGLHSVQRALGHARRSNRLHCLGDFMRADTPANGLQVLGHNDNSWDQGQLFITQNMSYLAPAGAAQIIEYLCTVAQSTVFEQVH